jgi:hypothetical protein
MLILVGLAAATLLVVGVTVARITRAGADKSHGEMSAQWLAEQRASHSD